MSEGATMTMLAEMPAMMRDRSETCEPLAVPAVALASDAADLAFAVIGDSSHLSTLGCEWIALQARCGDAGIAVFQSHGWIAAWARHFVGEPAGHGCRLAIVTVRRAGRLVAIWPLAMKSRLGIRQLVWAGAPVSQYGDVLVAPGEAGFEVLRRSWRFIVDTLKPDVVHLRKVRADAAVMPILAALRAKPDCPQQAPSMYFGDASDYAVYEQRYSGKARKNRRRLLRRLEERGAVAFVHHRPGPESAKLTRRAIAMKQAWLEHRGLLSQALTDARTVAFFGDVAGRATGSGDLLVSALTVEGRPCAIMVALTAGDRVAGHIFTYDLEFEKSGAGALLLEECLRHTCAAGYRAYDLLAPADAYKLDWADAMTDVADWTLVLTARGRLYDKLVLQIAQHSARALLARVNLGWVGGLRTRLADAERPALKQMVSTEGA